MVSSQDTSAAGPDSKRPQCPKCAGDVRTISVPVQGKNRIRYCCVKCRHKFDVPSTGDASAGETG